jgi:hypothetical protein
LESLELATFGIDHQELGAMFLKKWWEMPSIIIGAVTSHHKDYIDEGKNITLAEILSAANKLANENEISHPITTCYEDTSSEDFIKRAGLSQEELENFIDQAKLGILAFDCLFES